MFWADGVPVPRTGAVEFSVPAEATNDQAQPVSAVPA